METQKFQNILNLRGQDQMKTMTPARRDRFLRVMDGFPDLRWVFVKWNDQPRCDEVLDWLVAHHMTGKRLAEYFFHQFGPKPMSGFDWVLSRIDGK